MIAHVSSRAADIKLYVCAHVNTNKSVYAHIHSIICMPRHKTACNSAATDVDAYKRSHSQDGAIVLVVCIHAKSRSALHGKHQRHMPYIEGLIAQQDTRMHMHISAYEHGSDAHLCICTGIERHTTQIHRAH